MVEEKRNFPRHLQNDRVHVDILHASDQQIDTSVHYQGEMKDISHSGIRLHGKHPLTKDAILELLVEFETDHTKYHLFGCVKWVTVTTENEFIAGLELNDKGTDVGRWRKQFQ